MQYTDKHVKEENIMMSPCPKTPNCVSSLDTDSRHAVEPIYFSGNVKNARETLMKFLSETRRARVVSSPENFIRAEFTSLIFRFVDDVEFFFDDRKKVIHVKSASRIGYYDFGVNRRRIESIRKRFDQNHKQGNDM